VGSFAYSFSCVIPGVPVKFPEWFYCKHSWVITVYWEESPSKYSPWGAMHLDQWCCHCWKHFWKACCGIAVVTFFGCLQYPKIFVHLRQTLFLEIVRRHLEPNWRNRMGVPFQ
jgi:hypothetical protein